MIRFINLTGQIQIDDPEPHFAWYDTVINEFRTFNGNQEWNSWKEFEEDFLEYLKEYPQYKEELTARFKRLYQFKSPSTFHFDAQYQNDPKNHPTKTFPSSKE